MILNISLLTSLLLVLSIFFLYRGTNWPLGVEGIEVVVAFALLLALNLALFLHQRRTAGISLKVIIILYYSDPTPLMTAKT